MTEYPKEIWQDVWQVMQSASKDQVVTLAVQIDIWNPDHIIENPKMTQEQFKQIGKSLEETIHQELMALAQSCGGKIISRPKDFDYSSDAFSLELPQESIMALTTIKSWPDVVSVSLAQNYFKGKNYIRSSPISSSDTLKL